MGGQRRQRNNKNIDDGDRDNHVTIMLQRLLGDHEELTIYKILKIKLLSYYGGREQ